MAHALQGAVRGCACIRVPASDKWCTRSLACPQGCPSLSSYGMAAQWAAVDDVPDSEIPPRRHWPVVANLVHNAQAALATTLWLHHLRRGGCSCSTSSVYGRCGRCGERCAGARALIIELRPSSAGAAQAQRHSIGERVSEVKPKVFTAFPFSPVSFLSPPLSLFLPRAVSYILIPGGARAEKAMQGCTQCDYDGH